MSHNPLDWSDGIPDCIIFASTADAERGAAMYRSMADALDAKDRALREIAEEWAGAECGEPVTAQEAYAIHLAKRMYTLAVEALK